MQLSDEVGEAPQRQADDRMTGGPQTRFAKLRKPSIEETEDGGQVARVGFSDEDCCVPKYCKNFLCSADADSRICQSSDWFRLRVSG